MGRAWQQIQKSVVSDDGRLRQLFTLKPIDLYDTTVSLTVSEATVKMEIKSYLENLLTKDRAGSKLWPFSLLSSEDSLKYKFNVVVNGKMDYENVEIWVRNNFKDKLYSFRNGRYHLKLRDVKQIGERDKKLFFELDMVGSIRVWKFRIRLKSILAFNLTPVYDPQDQIIRVKDLTYKFQTPNLLLKLLDRHYHEEFNHFLEEVIEIPIKEDLFTAKIMAQEEMNKHQRSEKLIFNGFLSDLELERFKIEQRGVEAVFLARGNIQLNR